MSAIRQEVPSLPSQTKIINILMVWPFKVNSIARTASRIFECERRASACVLASMRLFLTADHTKNIIDFFISNKQKTKAFIKGTLKLILGKRFRKE